MSARGSRALRVVGSPVVAEPTPRVVFCSHCAKPPHGNVAPEVGSRVCANCGLGLLIDAPAALAPKARDAFLVVDRLLAVQGLSRRAEKLLGLREIEALDKPVTDLLIPADAEHAGPHHLGALVADAAAGLEELIEVVVRPADEFGVRFAARIGPCGPSPGALVVLDLG